jgi:hypothetical protein
MKFEQGDSGMSAGFKYAGSTNVDSTGVNKVRRREDYAQPRQAHVRVPKGYCRIHEHQQVSDGQRILAQRVSDCWRSILESETTHYTTPLSDSEHIQNCATKTCTFTPNSPETLTTSSRT